MKSNIRSHFILFQTGSTEEQIILTCKIALLSCMILYLPLWIPNLSSFPQIPLFSFFESIPLALQLILSSILYFILFFSLFAKERNKVFLVFTLLMIIAVFFDFERLQPWLYYFTIFVLVLIKYKDSESGITAIQFSLAFIYIFSGLQKFNAGFANEIFDWLVQPITSHLPKSVSNQINDFWILAPLIELSSGFGLLFTKTQQLSRWTLVSMHFFILLMIGPFGHNSNLAVWPWNLAFMTFLVLLFKPKHSFSLSHFISIENKFLKYSFILLFSILPFLSFVNLWPKHFSAALYSGNKIKSYIYLSDELVEHLPPHVQQIVDRSDNRINTTSWAMNELNVAIYPTHKAHIGLFKSICESSPSQDQLLVLQLFDEPDYLTGERTEKNYFCDDF